MQTRRRTAEAESNMEATMQILDRLSSMMESQQAQAAEDWRIMQDLLGRVLVAPGAGAGNGAANEDTAVNPNGPGVSGTPRRPIGRPQAQPPHKLSPNVSLREYKVWRSARQTMKNCNSFENSRRGHSSHTSVRASPLKCAAR